MLDSATEFWHAYEDRYHHETPTLSSEWQLTEDISRYVSLESIHHGYSLAMRRPIMDEEQQLRIVQREKQLALSQRACFEWKVFEKPSTPHLVRCLENEGFRCVERSTLLYFPINGVLPGKELSTVSVRNVKSEVEYVQLRDILFEVWGKAEQVFITALKTDAEKVSAKTEVFLAYVDGTPVACGWMKYYGAIAYFFGGSTIETARGKGAYKALVRERLNVAKLVGSKFAVSDSSPHSERVLRRLGFQDAGQMFRYVYGNQPSGG